MNKEKFLHLYNRVSIAFGVLILLFVVLFIAQFPNSYSGFIEKNLFKIGIESTTGVINILNAPLFIFLSLLVLNIYLLIRMKDVTVENKYLQNTIFNNSVLILMLIIGHLVFYYSIPDSMNGTVVNNFVFLNFQVRSNEFLTVINANYIMAGVFLIYNLFVAYKSPNPKSEKFDEEIYADTYYKQLDEKE